MLFICRLKAKRMSYRIRDILLASVALLLLSPILIGLAVVLKLRYGYTFFLQERPGYKGKSFYIYKFRTMDPSADGPQFTKMGAWMQKRSLDELPQIFNVLKGDMSLIGPRPLLMEYLPHYTQEEMRRHDVRPGITGWAQVNGRSAITFKKRFEMDVWYVDNQSHWLDLKIFLMTVGKVLGGVNAIHSEERYDGEN
jgi:lipopolysaccharide/colanic/teichoic acid biosynthesis glycosyltransferase